MQPPFSRTRASQIDPGHHVLLIDTQPDTIADWTIAANTIAAPRKRWIWAAAGTLSRRLRPKLPMWSGHLPTPSQICANCVMNLHLPGHRAAFHQRAGPVLAQQKAPAFDRG